MAVKYKKRNKWILGILGALIFSCCVCVGIGAVIDTDTPQSTSVAAFPPEVVAPSSTSLPTETLIVPTPLPVKVEDTPAPTLSEPTAITISGSVQVIFIDVGQGDSVLIRSPEGFFGLIDGGEANSGVVQYLQSQGVQSLDLVIATHPHSDHIGGLVEVLQNIPTARVVTNGQMHTTNVYENFLDAIAGSQAEYLEVKRGDSITLGSLTMDVLSPGSIVGDDLNHNSLVLRMTAGKETFLFMGDADQDIEAELLASGLPLEADILKVGHHGSRDASSEAFLAAVHPAIAVYTSGIGNQYGLPNQETLLAISAAGAFIYGTDVNGTIVFNVDDAGYTAQAAKEGLPKAPPAIVIEEPTAIPVVDTPAPADVSIEVISVTSPISAGALAQITIQTAPGAACAITVYYKSGASQAAGLGPQTADASGKATWSWKVGSRTTPGTWKIVVQSSLNRKSATLNIPFVVQ